MDANSLYFIGVYSRPFAVKIEVFPKIPRVEMLSGNYDGGHHAYDKRVSCS